MQLPWGATQLILSMGLVLVKGLGPQAAPKTLKVVTPEWEPGHTVCAEKGDRLFILSLVHLLPQTTAE